MSAISMRRRNTVSSRRTGEGVITSFEEKPSAPKSTMVGIALYYYPEGDRRDHSDVPRRRLITRINPAALCNGSTSALQCRPWKVPGTWFDVGSKETLEEANQIFAQFKK
jgi:glucose-1-phosphate thymidylyltransferase